MTSKSSVRRFHLIDIENLTGGPFCGLYRPVSKRYAEEVPTGPDDLLVVGSDASGLLSAAAAFPNARRVFGRGPDGADRALLAAVDQRVLATGFDELVIGSGDKAFSFLAAWARSVGLTTTAVVGRGKISGALRSAVNQVILLGNHHEPNETCDIVRAA